MKHGVADPRSWRYAGRGKLDVEWQSTASNAATGKGDRRPSAPRKLSSMSLWKIAPPLLDLRNILGNVLNSNLFDRRSKCHHQQGQARETSIRADPIYYRGKERW